MSKLMNKIVIGATKVKDWAIFRSPEILMAVGTVSVAAGVVLACKASMKLPDTIAILKDDLETVDRAEHRPKEEPIEVNANDSEIPWISYDEAKTLRREAYLKHGLTITKSYIPAAGLIIGGLGCFLYSHHIMTNRYAVLSSAYASLDGAFKAYREKVAEKIGEDEEKALYCEAVKDSEAGTGLILTAPYTFIWDAASKYYSDDGAENFHTLENIQAECNELFTLKGYIFLNEVLNRLDIPETEAGSICGWLKGNGDDYIDFGIWSDDNHRFLAGDENVAILNMNCDGVIFDKIWSAKNARSGGFRDLIDFKS